MSQNNTLSTINFLFGFCQGAEKPRLQPARGVFGRLTECVSLGVIFSKISLEVYLGFIKLDA